MENLIVNRTALVFVEVLFFITTCCAQQKDISAVSGTNPSSIRKNVTKYDEIEHARESDLVVIGEVVELEDLPSPSLEVFHSEALVRIDSVLKGTANFKTLILLRRSGPISDRGNLSPTISVDAHFKVGERGIYYFHRPNRDNYLTSPYIQRGLFSLLRPLTPEEKAQAHFKATFYGKQSLSELPDSVFWGDNVCRDVIRNGSINLPPGRETVESVAKRIRSLSPIINH